MDDDRTIKLKRFPREVKSIPVVCPWCNKLFRIEQWETEQEKKIGTSHGMCSQCFKRVKEEHDFNDDDE